MLVTTGVLDVGSCMTLVCACWCVGCWWVNDVSDYWSVGCWWVSDVSLCLLECWMLVGE